MQHGLRALQDDDGPTRRKRPRCYDGRRVMSKGRLSVLLVLALVLVNIQCVALCAAESCNDRASASMPASADVPPCHQHHQAPGGKAPAQQDSAACHHRVVQAVGAKAVVTAGPAADSLAAIPPAASLFTDPPVQDTNSSPARAPSPPGLDRTSFIVLRI